jgi:hypothetical protein
MLRHLQDPGLIARALQRNFSGGTIITWSRKFFEVDYVVAQRQVLKMSLLWFEYRHLHSSNDTRTPELSFSRYLWITNYRVGRVYEDNKRT